VEGTRIRRLEEQDIDAAIALTDLEHWGYARADFRRLRALSPEGCFVAESDRRVVGVLTTTAYDGLAFLGAVIVSPDLRGKGVGRSMMEAALDHLRGKGVRTVRLNAYLDALPFYEKLGFRREYEVIRWHGAAVTGRMQGVRPVRFDDLDSLSRFDERYFGADRRVLLERLADELPSTFLMSEHRGILRGFIVGNPSGDSCEIGPWVTRPDLGSAAVDLFGALVVAAGASEVAFSGPSRNQALMKFVGGLGLSEAFRALRMAWGADEFAGDPEGIWALGGLEKG
jgi:predicted N-acetyltransferase YhbS